VDKPAECFAGNFIDGLGARDHASRPRSLVRDEDGIRGFVFLAVTRMVLRKKTLGNVIANLTLHFKLSCRPTKGEPYLRHADEKTRARRRSPCVASGASHRFGPDGLH
jgi:hypothetical protein